MSRHRSIRNMDINSVLEEEDIYSEEEYENEGEGAPDLDDLTEEEYAQMQDGIAYIQSILPEDSHVPVKEIEDTLWYYYFDKEQSANWILDKLEKQSIQTQKKQADSRSNKGSAQGFNFDKPSPDDIVAKAQCQRGGAKASKTAPVESTITTSAAKINARSADEDEILEVEDSHEDEQLQFDLAALGLGDQSVTKSISVKPVSKSSSSTSDVKSSLPPPPPKAPKLKERINVQEEFKKRSAEKESMNLVIIGHVDAGKSTLMGHLLYSLGEVSDKALKKFERDSQRIGKGSFAFAWVLDETEEERSRGITMDVAISKFETPHRRFTLLDAPGHRDFVPNMISGAAQADVAILVVDSVTGEFEAGFEGNGQTREHALLVRSLGVQQMVIAVNKLDLMEWSQERYLEISQKLGNFLIQAGFKKQKLTFIPCSGLKGENLVKRIDSALRAWYDGPTIVEAIDQFEPPVRALDKPFRLSVNDFFKGGIGSTSGVSVAGRIESGHIQVGEQVMVVPGNEYGIVKALEVGGESAKWAAAGDTILVTLINLDILQLSTGSVLCSPEHPVPSVTKFIAQVVVFDVKVPITKGFPVLLHQQSMNEPATISRLISILDKTSGEVIKKSPRHLSKSTTATIEINLNRAIPLENFKENKELGRITLRKGGETIAAGVVIEIFS
ncbi:uncharacterized protein VTP21DRAFT_6808 [Calcarisporiella thermophila]|uniref:uncharacterized protein n=1 Tax=Calcarisporiella thermophila TaxID=911321 RepID=UPI00374454C7